MAPAVHTFMTTADTLKFNSADFDITALVSDVLDGAPLLAALAAEPCPGDYYKYVRKLTPAATGFRLPNTGVEYAPATWELVPVQLAILDASTRFDKAVAEADRRGAQAFMAMMALDQLRSALSNMEKAIIYGTSKFAVGFEGFGDMTNLDDNDDSMVVDKGGSGEVTSVYIIRSGPLDVKVIWGQDGEIRIGDMEVIEAADSDGKHFPAYYLPACTWAGLQVGSTFSVARIANIDATHKIDDDDLYAALSLFPSDRQPTHIAMNRVSLEYLRDSRTATNVVGTPAPRPTEVEGIPIIVTDSIANDEDALTPSGT